MTSNESFDANAYRQKLIDKGLDPDAAADVATRLAESYLASGYAPATPDATAQKEPSSSSKPDSTAPGPTASKKTKKAVPDKGMSKRDKQLVQAGIDISGSAPGGDQMTFMHTIMCQVGLPRSKVDGLEFERISGAVGLHVRAGKLWDGQKFVQQPIPYGPMPRLVMAYLNTQALRHRSPEVEVGHSASDFMRRLGKDPHGGRNGSYTMFRKQITALSACHMTIGCTIGQTAYTYDGKPIKQFEAWLTSPDGDQRSFWPGVVTFSEEYFKTLCEHAVPLDIRAMQALKGSALAMDTYAMLAERLHRIQGRPVIVHWKSLREQFGQEYNSGKEPDKIFKANFLPALKKVLTVYPAARVKQVKGGIMMQASPPPVPYKPT
jgi:hypothetical protein